LKPIFKAIVFATIAWAIGSSCRSDDRHEKTVQSEISSVWQVDSGEHRIYIAGSIHLLREKDYPLPSVFEQAYKDSTKLVLELPPGSEGNGEIVVRMRQMGSYPADDDLGKHMSPEALQRVMAWANKNAFPEKALRRFRPWFIALTIAAIEYQNLGAEAVRGVDAFYEKRAADEGKATGGLETVEYQLSLFAKLNDTLQEQLLMQTLTEIESMQKDFELMTTAWRSGDSAKLQEFLFRDAEKYPELTEQFLYKRNQAWVAPLENYLNSGERVMVLVGAGHIGGKNGLLELLKAKGCTVKQLGK
jgi:uncharacterized protein YbaP (TraB family)